MGPLPKFRYLQLALPTGDFITAFTELLSQTLNFVVLLLKKLFIIKNGLPKLVLYWKTN